MRKFIFVCLLLSGFTYSQSRSAVADPKAVKDKFLKGNYDEALKGYLVLHEKDPTNDDYSYNLALCYLNTNVDRSNAIPLLEEAAKKKNCDDNAMYYLGMAYHQTYRFDEAMDAFGKFRNSGKGDIKNKNLVDQQMEYCDNAKELMKFKTNVKFENLGKNINSSYADYMPFVPADESFVMFNSKRNASGAIKDVEGDGTYSAAMYLSKIVKEDFVKAKNIGPPLNNGAGDEEIVGMSGSGEMILLWRFEYNLGFAAISQSVMDKSKSFKKAEVLDKGINSQDQEIFATITNDGNTLYFSSVREKGFGGSDLYVAKRLPDGKWGKAVNLGNEINTDMDEDYPNLSPDGKTLYFSSNGHVSMGGFDIFKADWDETTKTFTNPKNLGYPINTPSDNNNLRISASGRYGYISALRPEGLGDLDIYKVIFKDVEPRYTVLRGNISCSDTLRKINFPDLAITVDHTKTNAPYGSYLANPHTGNYIVILPPGSFSLSFSLEGFENIIQKIEVSDKGYAATEIAKDFVLVPKKK